MIAPFDSAEEEECALALAQTSGVKRWVRNIANNPKASFWLPVAGGRFYPDFVAELEDGRRLVVEYKGADRDAAQSHKMQIGECWAKKSGGTCVFAWIVKDKNRPSVADQILNAIGRA